MVSSRSCRSLMPSPLSASRASISIASRSSSAAAAAAAALDDAEHDAIELGAGAAEAQVARRRHQQQAGKEREGVLRDELQRRQHRAPDAVGLADQIDAEQGLADDAQRHPRGVRHEVDRRAAGRGGLPVLQHARAGVAHGRRQALDALAMEGRLRQAALPPPEVALAGEEAVADQRLDPSDEAALPVVAVVVLQHVLDVVGVVQQVDAQRPGVEAHHVAVLVAPPSAASPAGRGAPRGRSGTGSDSACPAPAAPRARRGSGWALHSRPGAAWRAIMRLPRRRASASFPARGRNGARTASAPADDLGGNRRDTESETVGVT